MLPIETVVELLMENAAHAKCGGGQIMLGGELYDSLSLEELRAKVRTYLETLVPPLKLLSECEEGVRYVCERGVVLYRRGESAIDMHGYHHEYADKIKVIQPVEVNRE